MSEQSTPPPQIEKSPIGPARHEETTGEKAPTLRYIRKSLELLRPEVANDGTMRRWQDLHHDVPPWTSSHDLTDNIRNVIGDWITKKAPTIKGKAHTLSDMSDESLTEALAHGWFEGLKDDSGEEISVTGQRREVLLATMGHVVRKIETGIYMNILQNADSEQLQMLGLNEATRDLTMKLLHTSLRADPLFIRFMAYAAKSGSPEEGSAEGLILPENDKQHSFRELFPKETKTIGEQFKALSETGGAWEHEPGGQTFKEYLMVSSKYYFEANPQKAAELRKQSYELYKKYLNEGFPIVLTGPTDETVKAPYLDPELKVSIRSPDAKRDEESWKRMQNGFAQTLGELGVEDQENNVNQQTVVGSMVLGGYGVNLNFDAVAQENPTIQVYINSQARAYDRDFSKTILEKYITNAPQLFGGFVAEGESLAQFASRTTTVMHELGHWVFPEGSPEDARFGEGAVNRTMQEIKAETLYRALIPSLLEQGVIKGTKEQWANALVGTSIQILKDNLEDESDDYFRGVSLDLNDAFTAGVIKIDGNKVRVKDAQGYFDVATNIASEVLGQYRNPSSSEKTAKAWVKTRCAPNEQTRKLLEVLKK